ncbi:MAG TPA: LytTR family DNA-binding domain-containing protein [Gemmatimonadaceae bacterium]|nr:LytTR family DNA-binding domain-containing protein [Gemmatimonadaceae bacterium]
MIRVLIADDEALSRRALQQMLARHQDVEIVAECCDGAEAQDAIASLEPDVAFLDIRMPLATGLDLARGRADRNRTLVVFVTAFDDFALPAFDVDAADYLTKPLTEARFDEALARVRARVALWRGPGGVDGAAGEGIEPRESYVPHVVARVGMTDVVIPLDAIDYIEADDVYAAVVCRGKRQLVRTPLDALERMLDPRHFARVHRSYIVRIDRVVAVQRGARGARCGVELVLGSGATLPVSRRRRARVARLFTAS